jgi:septum formation protein
LCDAHLRLAERRGVERPQGVKRTRQASPLRLASTSPQRRAILEQLRIPFDVVPPDYVEDDPSTSTVDIALVHAEGKARSVHREGQITLGVDTTVWCDGRLYGKPVDETDARRMLQELQGREHSVHSGLCLLGPGFERVEATWTRVGFRTLTDAEIEAYLTSGEWRDRAGAYAIQGLGARLVARIDGDYLNVVGLPAALLIELLVQHAPELLEL